MGRNPFPRGASEQVLPPPCTSLANLHSPHHRAEMQLSARNDLWHLSSLDPRASNVYLRCFGLFPRSWQEISLLKLTQCCRNIAADVPHCYPLWQLWKLKDQKGTFGSRGTFPRAGVAASASLARAAVPKQAASELFWTHPDEILQTEAKSGEYFQNSASLWFPKVILSACKVAFTQPASGLKQELKRFSDSSRVVKNMVKEAVPMITDLLKPLWIMHLSCCKKSCGSDTVAHLNAWTWRCNYNFSAWPLASATAVTLLAVSWTRSPQLQALCSLGRIHQSPFFINSWSEKAIWEVLWYLPLLILLLGEGALNQNNCCSVGIHFPRLSFSRFTLCHAAVPVKLVQQEKPNSSWVLGLNLEKKASTLCCNQQPLSLQPNHGPALPAVPRGQFLAKSSAHTWIFCLDWGGGVSSAQSTGGQTLLSAAGKTSGLW